MEGEPLVTAKIVTAELGIPRSTLYRLVEQGKVPAEDVTQDWHSKRQYRFRVSEVRAALDKIKHGRPAR
jgi:predicted DNA-binding transcriptional regulator AlpA